MRTACWPCLVVSGRGRVSAQGGCLPGGGCLPRGCLPGKGVSAREGGVCPGRGVSAQGVCSPRPEADTPLWTDRRLWKHNLRKLRLWEAKIYVHKICYWNHSKLHCNLIMFHCDNSFRNCRPCIDIILKKKLLVDFFLLVILLNAKTVFPLTYSAIHKAAGPQQERPQRPFPYSRLQGFSGIVPGKAGNGSARDFVNSAAR